eukprot:6996060-Pyramimonas_sp.AAC.2
MAAPPARAAARTTAGAHLEAHLLLHLLDALHDVDGVLAAGLVVHGAGAVDVDLGGDARGGVLEAGVLGHRVEAVEHRLQQAGEHQQEHQRLLPVRPASGGVQLLRPAVGVVEGHGGGGQREDHHGEVDAPRERLLRGSVVPELNVQLPRLQEALPLRLRGRRGGVDVSP